MNGQQLIFDGKKYISSREASKTYHYAQDYVGQLIRAKKIEARLVGRSWFINEDSLKSYLAALEDAPQVSKIESVPEAARPTVSAPSASREELVPKHVSTVSYLKDDRDLLPNLVKKPVRESMPAALPKKSVKSPYTGFSSASAIFDKIVAGTLAVSLVMGGAYVADASRLESTLASVRSVGQRMGSAIEMTMRDFVGAVAMVGDAYLATIDHAGESIASSGNATVAGSKRASDALARISIPDIARTMNDNSRASLAAVGASGTESSDTEFSGLKGLAVAVYRSLNSLIEGSGSYLAKLFGRGDDDFAFTTAQIESDVVIQNSVSPTQTSVSASSPVSAVSSTSAPATNQVVYISNPSADTSSLSMEIAALRAEMALRAGQVQNLAEVAVINTRNGSDRAARLDNRSARDFTLTGDTTVTGEMSLTGSLSVIGDTTLTGETTIDGPFSFDGFEGVLFTTNGIVGTTSTSSLGFNASFFQQNGNSFGTTAVLGTNDASDLQLETNGSTRLTVSAAGNIGIGTTTPNAMLEILQTTNGTPIISAYRATDSAPSGDFINYRSQSGTELFRVDNSGNLLAGGIVNSGSQTITSVSGPQFRVQYDSLNEITTSVTSTGSTTIGVNGSAPSLAFTPQSNSASSFSFTNAAGTSILSVDTSGSRVGIGTTTPSRSLTVAGTGIKIERAGGATPHIEIINPSAPEDQQRWRIFADTLGSFGIQPHTNSDANIGNGFRYTADNRLQLIPTGGISSITAKLLVQSDSESIPAAAFLTGNVGIGTSTPDAKLAITATGGTGDIFAIASSSNTRLLTVTSAGNVGIGTTTPATQIQISAANAGRIRFQATDLDDSYEVVDFGFKDGRFGLRSRNSAGVDVADMMMFDPSTRHLGIGTFSPANRLTVAGAASIGGGYVTETAPSNGLIVQGNVGIGTTSPQAKLAITGTAGTGDIFAIASSTSARLLTVTSAGNVGIGVSNPSVKFAVTDGASTNDARIEIFNSGTTAILRSAKNDDSNTRRTFSFRIGDTENIRISADGSESTSLRFLTSSASDIPSHAGAERMRITSSGDVGIGTTTPSNKLEVAGNGYFSGNLTATGFTATSTGFNSLATSSVLSVNGTTILKANLQHHNVYLGESTGNNNIGGSAAGGGSGGNVAIGYSNLSAITGGTHNIAIGQSTLAQITTNHHNIAIGFEALNTSAADSNIGIGRAALKNNQGANSNTAVGVTALTLSRNSNNTAIGAGAGATLDNGQSNVFIGVGADVSSSNDDISNAVAIGRNALVTASNSMVLGGMDSFALNVGIGTTSPSAKLSVHTLGGAATNQLFTIASSSSTGTGTTTLLTVLGNGNVGIGTINPTRGMLHLFRDSGSSTTTLAIENSQSNSDARVFLRANGQDIFMNVRNDTVGDNNIFSITQGGGDSISYLFDATSAGTSGSQFFISKTGNIGIGTTSPSELLSVAGNGYFAGSLTAGNITATGTLVVTGGGSASASIVSSATDPTITLNRPATNNQSFLRFSTNSSAQFDIGLDNDSTNNLYIGSGGDSYATKYLTVNKTTGNIGIGTTSPSTKLSVAAAGNSSIPLFIVSSTNNYLNNAKLAQFNFDNDVRNIRIHQVGLSAVIDTNGASDLSIGPNDSGSVNLQTSGSPKLTVSSGGNVGIGTTSPSNILDIYKNQNAATYTSITNPNTGSSGQAGLKLSVDAGNFYVGAGSAASQFGGGGFSFADSNVPYSIWTNSTRRLTVSGGGNVGIGTSSPQAALHVYAPTNAYVQVDSVDASTAQFRLLKDNVLKWTMYSPASSNDLRFFDSADRFTLQAGGNVGIGTTAPNAKLDVAGSGLFSLNGTSVAPQARNALELRLTANSLITLGEDTAGSANPALTFYRTTGGGSSGTAARVLAPTNQSGTLYFQSGTAFVSYGVETYTTNVTFTGAGNVGIGETSPGSKLSVSGGATIGAAYDTTAAPTNGLLVEGNVGIGTTTPGSILSIQKDNSWIQLDKSSTTTYMGIVNSVAGANKWFAGLREAGNTGTAANRYSFYNFTNSSERMSILENGNVGVGTTSPTYALQVTRTGVDAASNYAAIGVTTTGTSAFGPSLTVDGSSISGGRKWSITSLGNLDGINTGALAIYDNTANQTRLLITSTGNVGIGTTSPGAKLDVYTASDNVVIFGENDARLRIVNTNSGNYIQSGVNSTSGSALDLLFTSMNAANTWMTIKNTGNVGIGATSPSAKLHVSADGTTINAALLSSDTLVVSQNAAASGVTQVVAGSDVAHRGVFKATRSRGTVASPTAAQSGDYVFSLLGSIYDGATTRATAGVEMVVDGAVSSGVAPQRIGFFTGPTDTRLERLTVKSDGNIGIGTTSPNARLSIEGAGTDTGKAFVVSDSNDVERLSVLDNGSLSAFRKVLAVSALDTTTNYGLSLIGDSNNTTGNILSGVRMGEGFAGLVAYDDGASAANAIGIFTGTNASVADRLHITSTGNVGIGNTSPVTNLHLRGGASDIDSVTAGGANLSTDWNNDALFKIDQAESGGNAMAFSVSGTANERRGYIQVGHTSGSLSNSLGDLALNPFGGNVGIGTTTPQQILSVNKDGTTSYSVARISNANSVAVLDVGVGGSSVGNTALRNNAYIGNIGNSDLIFLTNNTEQVRVTSSGNVGIGTTTPAAPLSVMGGSASVPVASLGGNLTQSSFQWTGNSLERALVLSGASGSNGYGTMLIGSNNTEATGQSLGYLVFGQLVSGKAGTNPGLKAHIGAVSTGSGGATGGFGADLTFGTRADASSASIVERMRITSAGNIGIGSTTPSNKLDVYGTTGNTIARVESTSGSGVLQLASPQSGQASLQFWEGPTIKWNIYKSSDANADLVVYSNAVERMRIMQSSGNVGIGTTTPASILSVQKSLAADEVLVRLVDSSSITYSTPRNLITAGASVGGGDPSTFAVLGTGFNLSTQIGSNIGVSGGSIARTNTGRSAGYLEIVNIASTGQSSFEFKGINYAGSAFSAMKIDTTGNIGIGTTTPTEKLVINGGATTGGTIKIVNDNSTHPDNGATIGLTSNQGYMHLRATNGTNLAYIGGLISSVNYVSSAFGIGDTTPDFKAEIFGTSTLGYFGVTNSLDGDIFKIDLSGNIGIGTTSPSSKLHVIGDVLASYFNATSTTATSTFSGGLNVGNGAITYNWASGQTSIDNLSLGNMAFESDSGVVTWVDMPVTAASSAGTKQSYTAGINGNPLLTVYGESDGLGGVQNTGVGIGTSTPAARLAITGLAGSNDIFSVASSSNARLVTLTSGGNFGVGTSSPSAQFTTTGTVRLANFGSGSLQTDAVGNVSVSSDERLKDISGAFSRGLAELRDIQPIVYHWNATSGLDMSETYAGFSAQNVEQSIPEAIGKSPNGYLSLTDRPIIAATVNAIKELDLTLASTTARLSVAEARIQSIETLLQSGTFALAGATTTSIAIDASTTASTTISTVSGWLSSLGATISNAFVRFVAIAADFIETKRLTVGDTANLAAAGITTFDRATGEPVCMFIENGTMKSEPGSCGSQTVVVDQGGGSDAPAPGSEEGGGDAPAATSTVPFTVSMIPDPATSEAGGTVSFTVVLDAQPAGDTDIAISVSDASEAFVDKTNLTFRREGPTAWDVPQTVIITGADDADVDGSQIFTLTVGDQTFQITNHDNEDAPVEPEPEPEPIIEEPVIEEGGDENATSTVAAN